MRRDSCGRMTLHARCMYSTMLILVEPSCFVEHSTRRTRYAGDVQRDHNMVQGLLPQKSNDRIGSINLTLSSRHGMRRTSSKRCDLRDTPSTYR
jgi:hypothetical protein